MVTYDEFTDLVDDLMATGYDFDYYGKEMDVMWIDTDKKEVKLSTLQTLKKKLKAHSIRAISQGDKITIGVQMDDRE